MFICGTFDERQSSRNRLFSIWFSNYNLKKSTFSKFPDCPPVEIVQDTAIIAAVRSPFHLSN